MTIWKRVPLPALASAAIVVAGASAAAASPAQAPTAATSPQPAAVAPQHAAVAQQGVTRQDIWYLQQAHQSNLAEIAAGKIAMSKSDNSTIKSLGSRLVTDHTRLDQSLRKAASDLGVILPNAPNDAQQKLIGQYNQASQNTFNRLFVTTQMAGHALAMQRAQTEITQGSAPMAKQVASEAAPVLAAHMRLLNDAAAKLGIPNRMPASPLPSASPR